MQVQGAVRVMLDQAAQLPGHLGARGLREHQAVLAIRVQQAILGAAVIRAAQG